MDEKLEICPLCGGQAELKQGFYVIDNYVECLKCGTRTAFYQTKAGAIKRWNTRKPMEKIVEQLEELAERTEYGECPHGECLNRCELHYMNRAIEIVKGGEVNE